MNIEKKIKIEAPKVSVKRKNKGEVSEVAPEKKREAEPDKMQNVKSDKREVNEEVLGQSEEIKQFEEKGKILENGENAFEQPAFQSLNVEELVLKSDSPAENIEDLVGREPLAIEGAEKKMASYQQDLYEKKDYQIGMQADSLLRGESNIPVFEQKRNEGSLGLIRDGTFSDGKRRESGIYDVSENNSGSSEQSRKYQPVV